MFWKPSAVDVAVMAVLCVLVPSCGQRRVDTAYWDLERERVDLQQQLQLAQYRLDSQGGGLAADLSETEESLKATSARLQKLKARKVSLDDEVRDLGQKNTALVKSTIRMIRAQALGQTFECLESRDGKTYQNARITSIDDNGIAIRHETGAARIHYSNLTPEQHGMFALDESSALAADDREQKELALYDQQLDQQLQALAAKQLTAKAADTRRTVASSTRASNALASNTSQVRPLARPATPVGSRSWSGYSSYRTYRPRYRYVYYSNPFYSYRSYYNLCRLSPAPRAAGTLPYTPSN